MARKVGLFQELEDGSLLLKHLALVLEHVELLDTDRVERRQGDVIGFGTRILARRDDVLPNDDDGQQHELQKRLAQPRDPDISVTGEESMQRLGQRDERDQDEKVGGPHRAHGGGDMYRKPAVEPSYRAGPVNR